MHIPRRSVGQLGDGGNSGSNGLWSAGAGGDRTALSSSVSSINMLDSESNSSDSSDDDLMDRDGEDTVFTTPHTMKAGNLFGTGITNSPGGEWMGNYSPAAASLLSFQRARLGKHRSRHSSSSGHSSKPSPAPLSPPILKSVETQGYFTQGLTAQDVKSRRESLSLGTNELHLDDSPDEDQTKMNVGSGNEGTIRGVIRRAVTRRGNLLPKTKNFARIRAELFEESAPIDSETKREAAVIHQVRESEPASARPSPRLQPVTETEETLESVLEDEAAMQDDVMADLTLKKTNSFSQHAEKNSGGLKFWNTFDERYRTPPPQLLPTRSSSGMSMNDDASMITHLSNTEGSGGSVFKHSDPQSRESTPVAMNSTAPTAAEVSRKVNNKRRRDDDFDPESFKRRAVSPGLSVASSPVMSQSPVFTDNGGKTWGRPPSSKAGNNGGYTGHNERSNSGGSGNATGNGPKRIGLQGMAETNDGLMNMSIE
ncbi:hypothetical protein UCRPC4_g05843 [Phaeomoniella chlamydospora]|uniref:Uncharacterized protein n=1 Tax=Phaeomoniella chlamydospora TaxID=158046 RepID=A0A0G2GI54_PHACM|nr:hypothetical protein UCRPC4_g05843 [Phaeomoniella chlamydospora]